MLDCLVDWRIGGLRRRRERELINTSGSFNCGSIAAGPDHSLHIIVCDMTHLELRLHRLSGRHGRHRDNLALGHWECVCGGDYSVASK